MKQLLIALLTSIFIANTSFSYNLTSNDEYIAETIVQKISDYDISYRASIISSVEEILYQGDYSDRIHAILGSVLSSIRLAGGVKEIPQEKTVTLSEENSQDIVTQHPGGNTVNLEIVRKNWLDWNNTLRNSLGLNTYKYSTILESSAQLWSEQAKSLGSITHKRSSGDSYYNYSTITSWFANNGVVCENISGITHSENIGWGTYSCQDGECSDELSSATRSTFDFYMSEKGKSNDVHYKSMTQKNFSEIGLGISVDQISQNKFKYYLTIHYCSNLLD